MGIFVNQLTQCKLTDFGGLIDWFARIWKRCEVVWQPIILPPYKCAVISSAILFPNNI